MSDPNQLPAVPAAAARGRERDDRYLTIAELAAATTFSVSTLRRLVKRRVIVGHQPGGPRHRIVFPPDAIERVAAAQTPHATAPAPVAPSPGAPPPPQRGPQPRWLRGI